MECTKNKDYRIGSYGGYVKTKEPLRPELTERDVPLTDNITIAF